MAQVLVVALNEVDNDDWNCFGWREEANDDLIGAIQNKLVKHWERTLEHLVEWTSPDHPKRISPILHLVGFDLTKIFETHFERSDARTENGPCARFIRQVLVELGIKKRGKIYELSTIARMIGDARDGRFRRVDKRYREHGRAPKKTILFEVV